MVRIVRIVLVSAAALAAGVGCSLAVAGQHQATGTKHAKNTKNVKAGKAGKTGKKSTKRRPRPTYRVRRGHGRGFVPRGALGPRWQLIGTPTTTTPATTTRATTPVRTTPVTTTTTTTDPGSPVLALGVTAKDDPWYLSTGGRDTLTPPGRYRVQLQNWGNATHDLVVVRLTDGAVVGQTEHLDPSGRPDRPSLTDTTVDFTRTGSYMLFCSIGDHQSRGMQTTVTVGPG